MNHTKPKIGLPLLLSLILPLGLTGCLFHHHSTTRNFDEDSDQAEQQPPPQSHKLGHKMPRSRASDLADMIRHPSRHLGQYVSTYGPVRTISVKPNGATEFQITTPNYAYLFIVDFPGEIPNLEKDRDTYFLGTVRGVQAVGDAEALVVDGIAIQTTGGRGLNPYAWPKAIYVPGQEQVTAAWLGGTLDLNEGRITTPYQGAYPMASAPTPQPQPPAQYYPQTAPSAYAPPSQPYAPPAAAPAPAPAYGAPPASADSGSLIRVVQSWNSLAPEARERILGIVSMYYSAPGGGGESGALIKVVQGWNSLPQESRERILGIVSMYAR